MKKIVLALCASAMMATTALAGTVDLSGMSYDELLELQKEVNEALWESDEWQEVEVPVGIYQIGKEIPAGEWTVSTSDRYTHFALHKEFNNGELEHIIAFAGLKKDEEAKATLANGIWLEITDDPVIFKPYVTSFTFK